MADLGGELDHGLRAQAPVEVVVEEDLGGATDLVAGGLRVDIEDILPQPVDRFARNAAVEAVTELREGIHMRTFPTLEDIIGSAGEELGTSDWLEIDQERVNLFAEATGDHQWIHVDTERARRARSAAPSRTATSRCR